MRNQFTGMQSDAQHQLGVWLVWYLEVMGHVEKIERQRGQLAGVTEPVGSRTSTDDHVSVADRLDLVDVIEVDATVELCVQFVEKLHHLQIRHTRVHCHRLRRRDARKVVSVS